MTRAAGYTALCSPVIQENVCPSQALGGKLLLHFALSPCTSVSWGHHWARVQATTTQGQPRRHHPYAVELIITSAHSDTGVKGHGQDWGAKFWGWLCLSWVLQETDQSCSAGAWK